VRKLAIFFCHLRIVSFETWIETFKGIDER
jgi:hypothetical protein